MAQRGLGDLLENTVVTHVGENYTSQVHSVLNWLWHMCKGTLKICVNCVSCLG